MEHEYEEQGGMSDLRYKIADNRYDKKRCNAYLFIEGCLDDIVPQLTYEQKRAVVRARNNNWKISHGDSIRVYIWNKGGSEECECVELVDIAEICTDLDLWG